MFPEDRQIFPETSTVDHPLGSPSLCFPQLPSAVTSIVDRPPFGVSFSRRQTGFPQLPSSLTGTVDHLLGSRSLCFPQLPSAVTSTSVEVRLVHHRDACTTRRANAAGPVDGQGAVQAEAGVAAREQERGTREVHANYTLRSFLRRRVAMIAAALVEGTFSEHSGNIQFTFSSHSVHIQ
jgi:hypothetical protein